MKKAILTLLLVAMSTGAMAEWVKVAETDIADYYIEPATIRKNGKMVKMWEMTDFKEPWVKSWGTYSSSKVQHEFDCSEGRRRILALVSYSRSMGEGNSVNSYSATGIWHPNVPGSVAEVISEVACGKIKVK